MPGGTLLKLTSQARSGTGRAVAFALAEATIGASPRQVKQRCGSALAQMLGVRSCPLKQYFGCCRGSRCGRNETLPASFFLLICSPRLPPRLRQRHAPDAPAVLLSALTKVAQRVPELAPAACRCGMQLGGRRPAGPAAGSKRHRHTHNTAQTAPSTGMTYTANKDWRRGNPSASFLLKPIISSPVIANSAGASAAQVARGSGAIRPAEAHHEPG